MLKLVLCIGSIILFLNLAQAVDQSHNCQNYLQPNIVLFRGSELQFLPDHFHSRPLTPGLNHLLRLVKNSSTKKQTQHGIVYEIPLDLFNTRELSIPEALIAVDYLNLPEDFLSEDERQIVKSKVAIIGLDSILGLEFQIPVLQTYSLPRIKIQGLAHHMALTSEGYPVLLMDLPLSTVDSHSLTQRANDNFILSGLKKLSDHKVISELLGVTKVDDKSYKAVFKIPAGFENLNLRMLLTGLEFAQGIRSLKSESSYQSEITRAHKFEDLIQRLIGTDWPLINFSLDLFQQMAEHPDLSLNQILNHLQLPLWQSSENEFTDPYLFPDFFPLASVWLPQVFSNKYRRSTENELEINDLIVRTLSTDTTLPIKDRSVVLKLESVKPLSKFGRLNLLRFYFFTSIANKAAKIAYLDLIYKQSPEQHKALLDLIKFLAVPLKVDKYLKFISDYEANRQRRTFQVISD